MTTQTKFTPGPWRVGDMNTDPDDGVVGEIAIHANGNDAAPILTPAVAIPFGDHNLGRALALANAHLIAAAPELYEALGLSLFIMESQQKILDPDFDGSATEASAIGRARAALRKARGEL